MRDDRLLHADLTRSIIGAFYETYNILGPWLPESCYARAMEHELRDRGHAVALEHGVEVRYKARPIGQLRLDMVVDERVVVELKAGDRLHPAAMLQLYGYLRSTRLEVGLLFFYGPRPEFRRAVFTNDQVRVVE